MPTKVWVVGEEVLAADFNQYVQEQVVAIFASAAARTTAMPTPKEGQTSYLVDVQQLQTYTAGAWRAPAAGARGWLGTKTLSGTAGFNSNMYDISAGGLAVPCGANRKIRVEAQVNWYGVLGALRHVNMRIVRSAGGSGTVTLGQVNENLGPSSASDIATSALLVTDTTTTAGNYTYRVDASTDHTADVGMAGGGTIHEMHVLDIGPATPAPQMAEEEQAT